MKFCKELFLGISVLFLVACNSGGQTDNASKTELETLIKSYEERESYDKKEYPLGLFTRAHYKVEAAYAENQFCL